MTFKLGVLFQLTPSTATSLIYPAPEKTGRGWSCYVHPFYKHRKEVCLHVKPFQNFHTTNRHFNVLIVYYQTFWPKYFNGAFQASSLPFSVSKASLMSSYQHKSVGHSHLSFGHSDLISPDIASSTIINTKRLNTKPWFKPNSTRKLSTKVALTLTWFLYRNWASLTNYSPKSANAKYKFFFAKYFSCNSLKINMAFVVPYHSLKPNYISSVFTCCLIKFHSQHSSLTCFDFSYSHTLMACIIDYYLVISNHIFAIWSYEIQN